LPPPRPTLVPYATLFRSRQRGRFSWYPAIGAQVFFGANGSSHVGRVYQYDADYIWTVEGNTNNNGSAEGNGVYLRKRARRDSYTDRKSTRLNSSHVKISY